MKCVIDIKKAIIEKGVSMLESKYSPRQGYNVLFVSSEQSFPKNISSEAFAYGLANAGNNAFKNEIVKVIPTMNGYNIVIEPSEKLVNVYYDEYLKAFKESTPSNIKPGLSELFESNPELANSVYEALGFKSKTSENEITRGIKEVLPYKVIGDYSNIEEGLKGRRQYATTIDGNEYVFEISTYSYENEDWTYQSYFDIDFTVNGSIDIVGTGFFDKSEKAKQIIQSIISQNFGNDTIRFNVEESKKGKQRLLLYKRLMKQLGYNPSEEMEYALFYDVNVSISPSEGRKVRLTPQQKQQAQQLYSQYLDTIFPDSKEKDIFYHGLPFIENKDDFFRDSEDDGSVSRDNEVNIRLWNYFFKKRDRARDYGDQQYAVVLNFSADFDSKELAYKASPTFLTNDSAIVIAQGGDEYAVKSKKQIHILGSKQDLKEFENYVKNTTLLTKQLHTDLSNLNFTPDVIKYLHKENKSRLSLDNYANAIKGLALNMQGLEYTNEEILDAIKCL